MLSRVSFTTLRLSITDGGVTFVAYACGWLQTGGTSLTTVSLTVDEIRRVTRALLPVGFGRARVLTGGELHYAAIFTDIVPPWVKMMLFMNRSDH